MESVKENTETSVECDANSANPASSVGMDLFIDGAKLNNIVPQVKERQGYDHGIVKTFVFKFTTDRSQNGKEVKCNLLWDQNSFKERKVTLNITCEFNIFYTINDLLNIIYPSHGTEGSEKLCQKLCCVIYCRSIC